MAPTDTDLIWDRVLRLDEKVDQLLALVKEVEEHQVAIAQMIARPPKRKKPKDKQPIGFFPDVVAGGVIPQDSED